MARESIFEIMSKKKDIKADIQRLLFLLNQECTNEYLNTDTVIDLADTE